MILVTGATGKVGRALVEHLVDTGADVRALTRDPSRASMPTGVEVAAGDLDIPESLTAALAGVRAVFLMRSGNEKAVAAAAREAGVERVVLLSSLAVPTRPDSAIGRSHLEAEEALADSGLAWTFVRPTAFASNALAWAPAIRNGASVRAPFADVAMPVVDPADIAAVAGVALTGDGHAGQAYAVTGPEALTPADQVQAIAAALGRPVPYEEISRDEALAQLVARHVPAEVAGSLLDLIGQAGEPERRVRATVAEVTGRPARPFSQWATEHADAFR